MIWTDDLSIYLPKILLPRVHRSSLKNKILDVRLEHLFAKNLTSKSLWVKFQKWFGCMTSAFICRTSYLWGSICQVSKINLEVWLEYLFTDNLTSEGPWVKFQKIFWTYDLFAESLTSDGPSVKFQKMIWKYCLSVYLSKILLARYHGSSFKKLFGGMTWVYMCQKSYFRGGTRFKVLSKSQNPCRGTSPGNWVCPLSLIHNHRWCCTLSAWESKIFLLWMRGKADLV